MFVDLIWTISTILSVQRLSLFLKIWEHVGEMQQDNVLSLHTHPGFAVCSCFVSYNMTYLWQCDWQADTFKWCFAGKNDETICCKDSLDSWDITWVGFWWIILLGKQIGESEVIYLKGKCLSHRSHFSSLPSCRPTAVSVHPCLRLTPSPLFQALLAAVLISRTARYSCLLWQNK